MIYNVLTAPFEINVLLLEIVQRRSFVSDALNEYFRITKKEHLIPLRGYKIGQTPFLQFLFDLFTAIKIICNNLSHK